MTYGGINRGIVLEHLKKAYIEYLHVEVGKAGKNGWKVLLTTKVNGISDSAERYTLRLQADPLFTDEIAIDLEANESRIVRKRFILRMFPNGHRRIRFCIRFGQFFQTQNRWMI